MAPGARVDMLELFFDLVFVFVFFTITRSVAAHLTPVALLQGLLILALLWWSWCAHTIVANWVRLGEGVAPAVVFVAVAAVLVIAQAIPHAFQDPRSGLPGPVVFAAGYLTVRMVHLTLHWYVARDDPPLRRQLRLVTGAAIGATTLVALTGFVPRLFPDRYESIVRLSCWVLAVVVEYGASLRLKLGSFLVTSAGHWVERFELIIIVAFGEIIISVGVGSQLTGEALTWLAVVTALLGIGIIATLWWAYFDLIGPAALATLHGTHGPARVRLARDAYNHLHLPMIAGLMGLALGGELLLHHLGTVGVDLREPLSEPGVPLAFGGVALYLLGLVGFQLRVLGTVLWTRLTTIVFLLAAIPFAVRLPALAAVAILGAACAALQITELVVLRTSRHALREQIRRERLAIEARETEWRRERYE